MLREEKDHIWIRSDPSKQTVVRLLERNVCADTPVSEVGTLLCSYYRCKASYFVILNK